MKFECIQYQDQYQYGIMVSHHSHYEPYHWHIFIDFHKWCLQFTFGKKEK